VVVIVYSAGQGTPAASAVAGVARTILKHFPA
jgi:hypothetical protein